MVRTLIYAYITDVLRDAALGSIAKDVHFENNSA